MLAVMPAHYMGEYAMEYKTVLYEAHDEFIERRSKFIGYVKPVATEEEAIEFINAIKAKHWDATHNVYAYCLRNGQQKRYSDDGEPQGTAGVPTLDVILKSGITDVVVVVTRYFGGILLGAGGLVRAYSHGARIAIDAGNVVTMRKCSQAELVCSYNQYGRINSLIPSMGGVIDDTQFTDNVTIKLHISQRDLGALNKQLAELTCGEIQALEFGAEYYPVEV